MSRDKSSNEEQLTLMMEDWEKAKSEVGPSITKDVIKEISKVSWDEIGGLEDLKWRTLAPAFHVFAYRCPFRESTLEDHGGNPSGDDTVDERLLTTLLTEMDGLEQATKSKEHESQGDLPHLARRSARNANARLHPGFETRGFSIASVIGGTPNHSGAKQARNHDGIPSDSQ
ncbi:hypothetical protein KSP40_PGU016200 [Platanthera guangdongensis]|uniref:Uncharacterized protein n=1 Tax=Platanthera guangdongensis TaxID=2320717 RepID=A0ABR2MUY9_9ASPA